MAFYIIQIYFNNCNISASHLLSLNNYLCRKVQAHGVLWYRLCKWHCMLHGRSSLTSSNDMCSLLCSLLDLFIYNKTVLFFLCYIIDTKILSVASTNPFPEAICSRIGPNADSSNRVRLFSDKKTSASLKFPLKCNSGYTNLDTFLYKVC